ncbi:Na(+)-translocating NADH-quinone reductase subunit C [Sediminicola luteus]|uniref:Na(+)-translocating NADH-quinone reductase subunit C n=1 Tax=Sediminicola luteus TaxID=319238 RepID=A0A2A4G640_9FLAO|nr:Na(+)-translocating NADH-quinone reductase subunit C [Sediminicola luteus]PCE63424.1 Na(+)-translocating NADH-quinone reductase subunit C [Sediminicola luteus]
MAINTEKNSYTVIFAAVMVIVVGSLLAFVASALKPAIKENQRFEKQQNILYAMGVHENSDAGSVNFIPTDKVEEAFAKHIKEQWVIQGGQITKDDTEAYLIDLKKQKTAAKEGRPPKLPLFVGEKDGETFYIIPMLGNGLWDAIWGYMSVNQDMVIQGVFFDHKAETPGLGANIKQRYFMDDFIGESIRKDNSYYGVDVSKTNNDPTNNDKVDNQVDALAGATITGDGLAAMVKATVRRYAPYLEQIRTEN